MTSLVKILWDCAVQDKSFLEEVAEMQDTETKGNDTLIPSRYPLLLARILEAGLDQRFLSKTEMEKVTEILLTQDEIVRLTERLKQDETILL